MTYDIKKIFTEELCALLPASKIDKEEKETIISHRRIYFDVITSKQYFLDYVFYKHVMIHKELFYIRLLINRNCKNDFASALDFRFYHTDFIQTVSNVFCCLCLTK
jgi:hypothetical protein